MERAAQQGALVAHGAEARKARVQARHLLAFAAARRRDLKLARERFAVARREAARLLPEERRQRPDSDRLDGAPRPILEEDAAYQHAVCTMGLGDKPGAEKELVAFVRAYPESPLVHACMRRIARLHGGDIPADVEAVWRGAMATRRAREKAQAKIASRCGPECLSELLRRKEPGAAAPISLEALAREMGTGEDGTTLAALQSAARRHGFSGATAVGLSRDGLRAQRLPVIALIRPGHFVLVEGIDPATGAVTYWDGTGEGIGKPTTRTVAAKTWEMHWAGGIALTTHAPIVPARSANRASKETAAARSRRSGPTTDADPA